jgi:hypothetical protein
LPPLAAVTGTLIVHELPAGIEPPVNVTDEALVVTTPPQVLLPAPETVTPLGKVSTSGALKVAAAASVLLKVIVRVDAPPAAMVAGLKALPRVGAVTGCGTVKVAAAGAALFPLLVCKDPAASESM